MLRVTFGLTLLISLGLLLVRTLAQLEWWQRKEYRLDRVWAALGGEESLTIVTPLFRLAIATTVLGWINGGLHQSSLAQSAGVASLVLLLAADAHWIVRRGVRRPKPSLKVVIIGVIAIGLLIALGSRFLVWERYLALQLATVALLLPLLVGAVVMIVNFPVRLQANAIIEKALARRRQHARVKVIGITGSYGKTSTKHFLQQLLQDTPGVIATAAHRNSPLPVARDILQQLNDKVTTYIVEMAAYRRGEIRELCTIAQPQIGVLTAIGNQHVALFGSLEALAATKWELIDSLPTGGTAVLNADDHTIVRLASGITRPVIWYSLQAQQTLAAVYVSEVVIEAEKITAQLHLRGEQAQVTIPLVSRALLGSAVAAAAGALALGVAPQTIFRTIQQLQTIPRTMELIENSRGATVIDDSYSANETGAVLAIEHLASFTADKKIIVLTPLIELGAEAKQVHERIGQALARSNATVYVTNSAYQADIVRGGKSVRDTFAINVVSDPITLGTTLSEMATSGSVVLLEGRLADVVRMKVIV